MVVLVNYIILKKIKNDKKFKFIRKRFFFNLNGIRNVIIFNTDLAMIAKHVSAGNFYCELVKQNPK